MDIGYTLHVPNLGYFVDIGTQAPFVTFSEDIIDAMVFEDVKTAQIVQRYLCWVFFKGERSVGLSPFPHNLVVEA